MKSKHRRQNHRNATTADCQNTCVNYESCVNADKNNNIANRNDNVYGHLKTSVRVAQRRTLMITFPVILPKLKIKHCKLEQYNVGCVAV